MKKKILGYIPSAIYVVLLLLLLWRFYLSQFNLDLKMSVVGSTWMARDQAYLVQVELTGSDRTKSSEKFTLLHRFTDRSYERAKFTPLLNGMGSYYVPIHCERGENLRLYLLDTVDQKTLEDIADKFVNYSNPSVDMVYSASLSTNQLIVRENGNNAVTDFPVGYSWKGFVPQTLNTVVVPSDFIAGRPNRVLFVDIRNGEPYRGKIEISVPGAAINTIDANKSGVTSIELTISNRTNVTFTAGDKVLVMAFEPSSKKFSASITGDFIKTSSQSPTIHIDYLDTPKDMVVDYFIGDGWIDREVIHAKQDGIYALSPGINYRQPRADSIDNRVDVVFVRLSEHGFPVKEPAQTFVRLASYDAPKDVYLFGALYQEFVKYHYVNFDRYDTVLDYTPMNEYYEDKRLQIEDWSAPFFAVASVLEGSFVVDHTKSNKYAQNAFNIDTYLRTLLAREHHPKIKRFEEISYKKSKLSDAFDAMLFTIVWLIIGIVAFVRSAYCTRNRLQQAWFDAAAMGKAKGVLPGIPIPKLCMIVCLVIALIMVIYQSVMIFL